MILSGLGTVFMVIIALWGFKEEYYTKVLEEYKQTKQYMGHFSVQSTSFDSGFKPDFIIEVPDLDKVQEEAIKYADKTYPPKFHEIDGNDFDDSETTKRSVAEQGFYDGGKFILDIFNFGTKVVLDKYENN